VKKLLTHNLGWKLVSLLIAAVIWLAIMNIADPVISETFTGIPVKVLNDEVITSRGYQYTIESGDKVDVFCKGKRSVIYSLSSADFTAYSDLKTLNSMYMSGIVVECQRDIASDIIITPRTENMAVKLEDQETSPFSVRVELGGKVKDGYYFNGTTLSSSLVQVSGAASQVAAVKEVVAYVDIDGKSETFTADSELIAYNDKGEAIDSMKLSFSQNTIAVTVEIYRAKPVAIEVVTKGNPISGYYVESVEYAPQSVMLAADEEMLDTLDKLTLELDVTGYSKETETQVSISDLVSSEYGNRVFPLDDQAYIGVVVKVVPFVERTLEVREQDILVRNVDEGLDYTLYTTTGQTVVIRGIESAVSNVTVQELGLYVDMSGCVAGTYSRQLRSDSLGDIVIVSGSVMVRLTVHTEPEGE